MSGGPGIVKRLLFALLSLILFFGLVEGVLWIAGVPTLLSERDPFAGFSEQVRVFELDADQGLYRTARRATVHSFNPQQFLADKPENGYRLFVLGGSSAYGFPWGWRVAFPRVLGDALRFTWPDRTIESVNAAAMSYGSNRLRILTRELLRYEPDLLVIYGGHNEFVERRFYREMLRRPVKLDRLRKLLYRWRLYSLLSRLYEGAGDEAGSGAGFAEAGEGNTGQLLGLDVVREYSEDVGEEEVAEVRARFEENLAAILGMAKDAGVAVVLCTVPSNLKDWKPNESFFTSEVSLEDQRTVLRLLAGARAALEAGDAAAAVIGLEKARSLAPRHAETQYRLGQAYEALGRYDEARESYVRARDSDGMPGRAVSAINETVRALAAEWDVPLADVEIDFERASPNGLIGFNLIEDYVHPKPEGHRLIALELWKLILERGLLGEVRRPDEQAFRAALEQSGAGAGEGDATEASSPTLLFNLAVVLENQGLVSEALEKYRACLRLEPRHAVARTNLGRLLIRSGRFSEAEAEFRRAIETKPGLVAARIGLGESLRHLGRLEEAERVLEEATRTDAGSAQAWNRLGVVRSQGGRQAEAEVALRRSVRLDPGNAEHQADLGYALLFQGKLDEAAAVFRTSVELRPDRVRGRDGLASVLVEKGRLDDAERLFRDSLSIDPGDAFARQGLQEIARRHEHEGASGPGP